VVRRREAARPSAAARQALGLRNAVRNPAGAAAL
jgi:hypothetical protein